MGAEEEGGVGEGNERNRLVQEIESDDEVG